MYIDIDITFLLWWCYESPEDQRSTIRLIGQANLHQILECEPFIFPAWLLNSPTQAPCASSTCGLHHDNVTDFFWRPCDFSVSLMRSGPYLVSLIPWVFHRTYPTINRTHVYPICIDFEVPRREFFPCFFVAFLFGLSGPSWYFFVDVCWPLLHNGILQWLKRWSLTQSQCALSFYIFVGGGGSSSNHTREHEYSLCLGEGYSIATLHGEMRPQADGEGGDTLFHRLGWEHAWKLTVLWGATIPSRCCKALVGLRIDAHTYIKYH